MPDCSHCHSFEICLTLAKFSRELIFSTNLNINAVRPVLTQALATNCSIYVDKRKPGLDGKSLAAGEKGGL